MSTIKFNALAMAAALSVTAVAQEAAKPAAAGFAVVKEEAAAQPAAADAAKAAEATKTTAAAAAAKAAEAAKVDPAAVLALIPDKLGSFEVDGKVIEIDSASIKAKMALAMQQGAPITPDQVKQYLPMLAEQAVMEKLLPVMLEKKGFKGDTEALKKELAALKEQIKDEAKFKQFLAAQGVKTEDELIAQVAQKMALDKWVASIREPLAKTIVISDKEIADFYTANAAQMKYYTCSHILAKFSDGKKAPTAEEDAAALKKINEVLDKLAKGGDFAALAKEYSDCPSKEKGGLLDEYNPEQRMPQGQMVAEFTEAFNKLNPGESTLKPVKTQFGYHIIRASEVKTKTLDEVKENIKSYLTQDKLGKLMNDKMKEVLAQINAEYKVKFLAK